GSLVGAEQVTQLGLVDDQALRGFREVRVERQRLFLRRDRLRDEAPAQPGIQMVPVGRLVVIAMSELADGERETRIEPDGALQYLDRAAVRLRVAAERLAA